MGDVNLNKSEADIKGGGYSGLWEGTKRKSTSYFTLPSAAMASIRGVLVATAGWQRQSNPVSPILLTSKSQITSQITTVN